MKYLEVGLEYFGDAFIATYTFYLPIADLILDVVWLEEGPVWGGGYLSQMASILPLGTGSSMSFFLISVSVSSISRLPLLINKYMHMQDIPFLFGKGCSESVSKAPLIKKMTWHDLKRVDGLWRVIIISC
jgi:hypothetical protein